MLRISLTRFNISSHCLSQILQVTSTLLRKTQNRADPIAGLAQLSTIPQGLFEVLSKGLRKEGRVLPSTIASMIEVCWTVVIFELTSLANNILLHRQFGPLILPPILSGLKRFRTLSYPWQKTDYTFCRIILGRRYSLKMTSPLRLRLPKWFYRQWNRSPTSCSNTSPIHQKFVV